ncbi:retrotransposon protein putative Ty1-copia subclass, partial [Trifolium medium]|nr:retrotransposon protein putative Ty1-copia subclass [Trifolium medium]
TTAAYLINRCPSTGIDLKTPMKVWSGSPANYSNLKVFRSGERLQTVEDGTWRIKIHYKQGCYF